MAGTKNRRKRNPVIAKYGTSWGMGGFRQLVNNAHQGAFYRKYQFLVHPLIFPHFQGAEVYGRVAREHLK